MIKKEGKMEGGKSERGKVHNICFRRLHQRIADAKRFGLIQRKKNSSTCLSGDGQEKEVRVLREKDLLKDKMHKKAIWNRLESNRASGTSGEKQFPIEE